MDDDIYKKTTVQTENEAKRTEINETTRLNGWIVT